MKNIAKLIAILMTVSIFVSIAQTKNVLSPTDFERKITNKSQIIDVRTIEEFNGGHLKNAALLNIYSNDFKTLAAKLDKTKPVFVYCKAGGRSTKAAGIFTSLGFKEVYDLEGGYMNWKSEKKPVEGENIVEKAGLSIAKFDKYLTQHNDVLVVFSAKWCIPCKKLAPILDEIAMEEKNISIFKLEYDDNNTLVDQYEIKSMPTLIFFKNRKLIWRNEGFIEKNMLVNKIYSKLTFY